VVVVDVVVVVVEVVLVVVLLVVVGASVVVVVEVELDVLTIGVLLATEVVAQPPRSSAPAANMTDWPRTRMMVANPIEAGSPG
jgi:hypothetical protein